MFLIQNLSQLFMMKLFSPWHDHRNSHSFIAQKLSFRSGTNEMVFARSHLTNRQNFTITDETEPHAHWNHFSRFVLNQIRSYYSLAPLRSLSANHTERELWNRTVRFTLDHVSMACGSALEAIRYLLQAFSVTPPSPSPPSNRHDCHHSRFYRAVAFSTATKTGRGTFSPSPFPSNKFSFHTLMQKFIESINFISSITLLCCAKLWEQNSTGLGFCFCFVFFRREYRLNQFYSHTNIALCFVKIWREHPCSFRREH